MALEGDAALRERLDMRKRQGRAAGAVIGAPLVGGDEQDVVASGGFRA